MKVYSIIGGVDGVGKSSFLGVIKELDSNIGVTDIEPHSCFNDGLSFTQETTLADSSSEATAKEAKDSGYYVRLFYVALDTAEESMQRIQNRVKRGGHNIQDDDVVRRFAGRWEAVRKILPFCDVAEFYDNDNGFVKVADYRNGQIRPAGELRPRWLLDLIAYQQEHH